MSLSIQTLTQNLSFSTLLRPLQSFVFSKPSIGTLKPPSPAIRMGGGPRTFPGGVSKWQWKRMQAKKAKQLLKARLCRERQIYEMRKRAELRAAVSDLERPWEVVERAPTLFSVSADDQVKVLADRFQRPGGFDMWTDNDGPELFRSPDELPSARFFPKGVVHSVKPYQKVSESDLAEFEDDESPSGEIRALNLNSSVRSDWEGKFDELDLEDRSMNELASLSGDRSRFRGQLRVVSGKERSADSVSLNSRSKKKRGTRNLLPSGSIRSALSNSERSFGESDGKSGYERKLGSRSSSSSVTSNSNRKTNGSLDSNSSMKRFGRNDGVSGQQRNSRYRSNSFGEGENKNERSSDSRGSNSINSFKQRNSDSGKKAIGRGYLRNGSTSSESGFDRSERGSRSLNFWRSEGRYSKSNGSRTKNDSQSEVYNMSLEHDGSYRFQSENGR